MAVALRQRLSQHLQSLMLLALAHQESLSPLRQMGVTPQPNLPGTHWLGVAVAAETQIYLLIGRHSGVLALVVITTTQAAEGITAPYPLLQTHPQAVAQPGQMATEVTATTTFQALAAARLPETHRHIQTSGGALVVAVGARLMVLLPRVAAAVEENLGWCIPVPQQCNRHFPLLIFLAYLLRPYLVETVAHKYQMAARWEGAGLLLRLMQEPLLEVLAAQAAWSLNGSTSIKGNHNVRKD